MLYYAATQTPLQSQQTQLRHKKSQPLYALNKLKLIFINNQMHLVEGHFGATCNMEFFVFFFFFPRVREKNSFKSALSCLPEPNCVSI